MGYVYLICDPVTDHFKIGVTRNKECHRIKELQTGNAGELFIHSLYETKWPFRLETILHKRFQSKRILNEWFELTVEDVNSFMNICKSLETNILELKDNPFFSKDLK